MLWGDSRGRNSFTEHSLRAQHCGRTQRWRVGRTSKTGLFQDSVHQPGRKRPR